MISNSDTNVISIFQYHFLLGLMETCSQTNHVVLLSKYYYGLPVLVLLMQENLADEIFLFQGISPTLDMQWNSVRDPGLNCEKEGSRELLCGPYPWLEN